MSTVVRTSRLGHPRTGRSNCLLDIGHCDICSVFHPSHVGFLIGDDHPQDGNCRLLAAVPMTVDVGHLYYGRMDDRRGMSGHYGARSAGRGRLWFG